MLYDFLKIYYPNDGELDLARVREVRSLQALRVRNAYPEADTTPNSPFGDTYISPAAFGGAAAEEAFNRFLSDLDLDNVAAGVAWNCAWLEDYLQNFGIYTNSAQAYGILRLRFADSSTRTIDRSTVFQINGGLYNFYLPFSGPLILSAPGSAGQAGANTRNYNPLSTTEYVADLLVMGAAGVETAAGAAVEVDRDIPGLTGAVTLAAFRQGTAPTRIQELARLARNNFYSRTPVNRGGAVNMISQQFPEIRTTAAIVSGDYEMLRDAVNVGQVAAGALDLLVRAPTLLTDSVQVELDFSASPLSPAGVYAGFLDLPETAIRIVSAQHGLANVTPIIYSISTDPKTPKLSAAYGKSERLLAAVVPFNDASGNPVLVPITQGNRVFVRLTVTYEFDPDLKVVQEFVANAANRTVGLDLYVRGFVPVPITELQVTYNKRAGVTMNLAQARADILTAFNAHTFDSPATPAAVADAMFYAGAHSLGAITLLASVRYSVAQFVWVGTSFVAPTNNSTWVAFLAACVAVPTHATATAYEPGFEYVDQTSGTFAVSGRRNVSWLLRPENLQLVELQSV